jgi:hypothetical protein
MQTIPFLTACVRAKVSEGFGNGISFLALKILAKFRSVRISTTKVVEYFIGANNFQKNNQLRPHNPPHDYRQIARWTGKAAFSGRFWARFCPFIRHRVAA